MNLERRTQGATPDAEPDDELVRRAEASREPFAPELVLFVDESESSTQAHRLVSEAGTPFRVLKGSGPRIPALVFGGVVGEQLAGVRGLLHALRAFEDAFLHPHTAARRDWTERPPRA